MISTDRMHLYLALLFHRDYFDRPDASLSDSFAPQRLLYPGQMHLYLALLCRRDYFDRLNASLSGFSVPQGLFQPAECISVVLFCSAGIISTDRMHPITERSSLKTSLPGHSVNSRFVLLISLFNSMHTMACPASHKPMALCSSSSSLIFLSSPPAYPVKLPSAPTTRWHGMMIEMGLRPTAPPTACADILDIPCFRAMCPAISP